MPYVLYQVWAFIAPGLYKHEKRFAVPLLVSSIVLFYTGVAFAYFVVFPLMFTFLASTTPRRREDDDGHVELPRLRADAVLRVRRRVRGARRHRAAGRDGLVRIETLKENRGYVILGIFVVAAILTPPDAMSQCFMAVPMWLLYEFGIVFAQVLLRDKLKTRAEADAEAAREEAAPSSK